MKLRFIPQDLTIRFGGTHIVLGSSWLVIALLGLWATGTLYVPIMAPFLGRLETWGVAFGIMLLVGLSLVAHVIAHIWTARVLGHSENTPMTPARTPLYLLGDAAQVWPAAPIPRHEALIAIAGPAANLLLAGLAYLIWDRQWHPDLNVSMIFLAVVNAGLAAVNLAPAFPLDGGRLARAIIWALLGRPTEATRLSTWLGCFVPVALAIWGVILILKRARFSLETGTGTLFIAGMLGLALWNQPAWQWERRVAPPRLTLRATLLRGLAASAILLSLLGITLSLIPTVNGLEAPGFAIPVEPMISVPPEYRHPYSGSFILTSVISQTPIVAGQWIYARLSPVVEIVPPERVVPPDITPQELMERNYKMLEESETVATVVALRLAGYEVQVVGEAAEVVSILPESPAQGILQPGDRIIGLNGEPIRTASQLIEQLRMQNPYTAVELLIERGGQELGFTLPLIPPASPGEPPRLGITVQTVGYNAELPFPVTVEPQKIAGGPSAGLMFTLTIYNLITPEDLTGGRKIAGTGTINLDGRVGPIGGVKQKVAGAERAGAEYFLVPPENYEDARSVARRIVVVKVATAQEAIDFLRNLPAAKAQSAVQPPHSRSNSKGSLPAPSGLKFQSQRIWSSRLQAMS